MRGVGPESALATIPLALAEGGLVALDRSANIPREAIGPLQLA